MIIAIAAISAISMMAAGQGKTKKQNLSPEERKAQMINARVKTMKEKLLLTSEQTEKFIPLYQEYYGTLAKECVTPIEYVEQFPGVQTPY